MILAQDESLKINTEQFNRDICRNFHFNGIARIWNGLFYPKVTTVNLEDYKNKSNNKKSVGGCELGIILMMR